MSFFTICGQDLTTGGDFTDELASQSMCFLVTGRFDCFVRFRGAVNSRISTTRAVNVTQYLLITRRVWAIINEDISKRFSVS